MRYVWKHAHEVASASGGGLLTVAANGRLFYLNASALDVVAAVGKGGRFADILKRLAKRHPNVEAARLEADLHRTLLELQREDLLDGPTS